MALINCPECGKEVSDKAKLCPNCGCPNYGCQNEIHYEKFADYVCDNCGEGLHIPDTDIRDEYFCPKCNSPVWYFISSIVDPSTGKEIDTYFDESRNIGYRALQQTSKSTPKCPICQSTNLSKISTTKKVAKVGFFGIFGAGDIGKTWKCNNCGSRF